MKKQKLRNRESLTDVYSLFVDAIRIQLTRDYYLRRLRTFFDFIELLSSSKIEQRCNHFAATGIKDPKRTFGKIIGFLQFQKERVEREEITSANQVIIFSFNSSDDSLIFLFYVYQVKNTST